MDNQSNETPLDSWKEIAAHLQRDVRTLMRWEKKEGLPVHRHLHKSRSSVYAYPSELDAWRADREPAAESTRSLWFRPVPAFGSTIVIALALMMAGSGPQVGTVAQAADGSGPTVRRCLIFHRACIRTLNAPNARVPDSAQRRWPTSFCTMMIARFTGVGGARKVRRISLPTE